MDTCCPGELSNTNDQAFHFLCSSQHQICQLVYYNHDLLHPLRICLFTADQTSVKFIIVTLDIVHSGHLHSEIPVIHFIYDPAQRTDCLSRVRHNIFHHMRDTIEGIKFHLLWIHNDHAHFRWFGPEENGHDK